MIINATQIRVGMILDLEGELYRVTWTMHRTPGKGNACMQTKLKHVMSGKNMEMRYLSNERVKRAELATKEMQYLYHDGENYLFMDNATFDQMPLSEDLIGEGHVFLQEGQTYFATFFNDAPVGLELPKTVELKVTSAPPEIRKATASSSLRPIEVEGGMTIQAPAFIKEGDVIKINTETMEYLERV
jgi:elongation factor P